MALVAGGSRRCGVALAPGASRGLR